MSKVSITRSLLDDLAMSISAKSGEAVPLTLTEMKDAVDSISGGDITVEALSVTSNGTYTAQSGRAYSPVTVNVPTSTPSLQSKTYNVSSAGTATVTADSGYDGLSSVAVSVPQADPWVEVGGSFFTENNIRKYRNRGEIMVAVDEGDVAGYLADGYSKYGEWVVYSAVPSNTTITPTESAQTIGGENYMMEGAVTVNAIPSNYVGTGITQRSSSDLTASGATVTVPSGYYSAQATKSVASGSIRQNGWSETETETSISMSPNLTFIEGYFSTAPTITRTFTKQEETVTPSLSQQVVSQNNNAMLKKVTIEAIPSGTAGTPTATKGTVSNHSVSVTPSVTNTTGYITGSTKTGTAVTVSASELVSGSETKTANGTYDVTNLASLVVDIDFVTYYTGSSTPSSSLGSNGDIYLKVVS